MYEKYTFDIKKLIRYSYKEKNNEQILRTDYNDRKRKRIERSTEFFHLLKTINWYESLFDAYHIDYGVCFSTQIFMRKIFWRISQIKRISTGKTKVKQTK